jgi:hypothetical protein
MQLGALSHLQISSFKFLCTEDKPLTHEELVELMPNLSNVFAAAFITSLF